jgi:hypothetical protein
MKPPKSHYQGPRAAKISKRESMPRATARRAQAPTAHAGQAAPLKSLPERPSLAAGSPKGCHKAQTARISKRER